MDSASLGEARNRQNPPDDVGAKAAISSIWPTASHSVVAVTSGCCLPREVRKSISGLAASEPARILP